MGKLLDFSKIIKQNEVVEPTKLFVTTDKAEFTIEAVAKWHQARLNLDHYIKESDINTGSIDFAGQTFEFFETANEHQVEYILEYFSFISTKVQPKVWDFNHNEKNVLLVLDNGYSIEIIPLKEMLNQLNGDLLKNDIGYSVDIQPTGGD